MVVKSDNVDGILDRDNTYDGVDDDGDDNDDKVILADDTETISGLEDTKVMMKAILCFDFKILNNNDN